MQNNVDGMFHEMATWGMHRWDLRNVLRDDDGGDHKGCGEPAAKPSADEAWEDQNGNEEH